MTSSGASKLLANALRKVQSDPTEGFACELINDDNLFQWHVYVEGPKGTAYEGGIFKLRMEFPPEYPMKPPTLKFISEFWHPNVYTDGTVCLSILHPPGDDPTSGELPEERWLPSQTVATIVLSLISMLDEPNFSSPANVDASVQWRNKPEQFKASVAKTIEKAEADIPSHVRIPHPDTDPEERQRAVNKLKLLNEPFTLSGDDFGDDLYFDEDEEDDDDMDDEAEEESNAA